ncbi:MAG: exonuclease domain-containing protein [Bacteroidota bacterium]
MIQLNLTKPIAFFDLETTGVNVASDRIVEISILKIQVDGTKEIKTRRVNPTIPIPKVTSEIHGIYDSDVANEPTFKIIAKNLAEFLFDCDLAGYNSNKFDVPILVEEFMRAEVDFDLKNRRLVDVQNIFHQMEQRTLRAAYQFYCGKDIVNAHSAEADIEATYEVFLAQLEKYDGVEFEDKKGNKSFPIKNDIKALHDFTNLNKNADLAGRIVFNDKGEEVFNFGKHTGKSVEKVLKDEPSYYSWMMNGDFPLFTKKVLTDIKLRMAFNR